MVMMLGEAAAYVRNDRFRSFHQSSRHRELAVSARNHVAGQADPETVRKSAFKLREPLAAKARCCFTDTTATRPGISATPAVLPLGQGEPGHARKIQRAPVSCAVMRSWPSAG